MSCLDLWNQRRRLGLVNVPPTRLTPISPYLTGIYTQQQLDMRRKAEILQYSANKSNTKTNNLTRKEKWSQIARGNYAGKTLYCEADDSIQTPTSSSGVPGPIKYLFNDSNIPLYNYASNVNAYAIQMTDSTPNCTVTHFADIQCASGKDTNIASLYIQKNLEKDAYTYTITTPISIYLSGTYKPTTTVDVSVDISINSIKPTVFYNNRAVPNVLPTYTIVPTTMKFDISGNKTGTYSEKIYVGVLTITNINLYTEPGFIYDVFLNCNINNGIAGTYLDNISSGIYCNLSNTINTEKLPASLSSFSMVGS